MRRRHQPLIDLSWMLKTTLGTVVCERVSRWFPLAPELAEVVPRLGWTFGVQLDSKAFVQEFGRRNPVDLTAAELHKWVCGQLRGMGKPLPFSSWHRVQRVLCDMTGTPPQRILPSSLIDRDLHYFEGG